MEEQEQIQTSGTMPKEEVVEEEERRQKTEKTTEPIGTGNSICIAFFGSTGGCTLAALDLALKAGFRARALVRSPEKLLALLADRATSKENIDQNLVIIKGNAKDVDVVQKTLIPEPGRVVDQIVFGIGGVPKFAPNPLKPTLDDPTVCQTAIAAVISSLKRINDGASEDGIQKPVIIAISSTGISSNRDLPVIMSLLYKWLGEVAHADKRKMESLIEEAAAERSIGEFVIVRPSLLTNGRALGESKVRVGWEKEDGTGAAIGYTISRADVGSFIFDKIIRSNADGFRGKKVSVTY